MPKKAKPETASIFVPEAEQPYKIPDNWRWVRLSALASPSKETTADFSADIRYVGLEHMETGRGIVSYGNAESVKSVKNVFHDGQILYGKLRPYLNKHDIADFSGVCSTDILVFEQTACSCAKYVNYYFDLPYFFEYAVSHSRGIHLPRVTESILLNAACPLPPLAEQQRIVERIESLFTKLDAAREKAQAVVDGFELRKAAILHRAFTGELTAQWRENRGISKLDWIQSNLGNIADVKGGKRVPKGMTLVKENTGHPYLKAGNLKHGTVLEAGIMYVPDSLLEIIGNYTVKAGDVYITNVGACIGDCGIIPQKFDGANLTENAVKLTNLKCDGDFLALYLSSGQVQLIIKNMIASATLGKLSIANIKLIPIEIPCKGEQQEIVAITQGILSKEERIVSVAEHVISQIDMMKKAILGRAFRGELGTNNPSEAGAEFAVTVR